MPEVNVDINGRKYRMACERQLAVLQNGFDLGSQGAATWQRAELHER